jgi:molybdopterin molybdotransferase
MPQGFGTVALPTSAGPKREPRGGLLSRLADRGEVPETPVRTGEHDRVPIFTLPGNPVSAYVSFQVFVRPAIGALQAYDGLGLEMVRAELTGQGSHQVATLGKASALIIVPEQVTQMAAGETADVLVLP